MDNKTLIFINYRGQDCSPLANYLAGIFKNRLGEYIYFLDKENIDYGNSITDDIFQHLESAKVLLALIGPSWHLVADQYNDKRLIDPSDWVRREIEIANEQKKTIIPVLSDGVDYSKVTKWLKIRVPTLAFMSDLKAFTIHSTESDCNILLNIISEKIGIPLRESSKMPVISSKEDELKKELNKYFPLLKKYQIPKAEIPFVGLDYFKKEDAPLFFGRTSEILKICKSVKNFNLILIFGHSGVGKSSLLHAGILPRLEDTYWVEYLRRDKSVGYHHQLTSFLSEDLSDLKLIILDQVEEIYSDKRKDWRDESTVFWDILTESISFNSSCKFVLIFRSEHYPNFKDFLIDRQIQWTADQELHLTPLNLDGIREAILGVEKDPYLCNQYKIRVEEKMVSLFSNDLIKEANQDSQIGPLLQYQLRKLWDDAYSKRQSESEWIFFDTSQYKNLRFESLEELLDDQFAKLKPKWNKFLGNGLVLDVLYGYTTDLLTATVQLDRDVLDRYDHIDGFPDFFDFLRNRLLLLIGRGKKDKPSTRLAHDSLAPLIRHRFQSSNASGQQAYRLVEAKSRESDISITFSESDIEMILSGQFGMCKVPNKLLTQILKERDNYDQQKQNRVNFAIREAEFNIEHLEFDEALNNLKLAFSEKFDDKRIWDLASQLLYPLEQLGRRAILKETKAFLREQKPKDILEKEDWEKFFPATVEVKGGVFNMGSEEGFPEEQPLHKVHLSTFFMGATPVTWYQYGLFCLLTNRDFPNDSGFGRGNRPVINVNWYDAVDYCIWLTERLNSLNGIKLEQVYTKNGDNVTPDWSKNGFRLPTEAEWEYAARERGRNVRFGTGMNVADPKRMNFEAGHILNEEYPDWYIKGKGLEATTPVRKYPANKLGLYDMSGNVYEWCWDRWSGSENDYYKESDGDTDPVGSAYGVRRVIRGGSWIYVANLCRCTYRWRYNPFYRFYNMGFRVVRR